MSSPGRLSGPVSRRIVPTGRAPTGPTFDVFSRNAYFRGVVWPRVKEAEGKVFYHYTVVGVLVTDKPVDGLDGDGNELILSGELDGEGRNLPELLAMVPHGHATQRLGDASGILHGLDYKIAEGPEPESITEQPVHVEEEEEEEEEGEGRGFLMEFEVSSLKKLRTTCGLRLPVVAAGMNRSVRYVQRMERRQLGNCGLHALRRYVRALGGKLNIRVTTREGLGLVQII